MFRLDGPIDIGHDGGPDGLKKIDLADLGLVLLSLDVFGHLTKAIRRSDQQS